jgi:hypothetical protein
MTAETAKQVDREQARESANTLRILGGMLLVVALLLYFFHLAETPTGQHLIGWLAAAFAATGAALFWVGQRKIRPLL